jgi:hypothetical protein
MPLDERFFTDFLEAFLLETLPLVEAFRLEAFEVETRLLPLAPARFLMEGALTFRLDDFLAVFLALREVVVFFEADRPLLDFLAADPLRALVVGMLSSFNALLSTVRLLNREKTAV